VSLACPISSDVFIHAKRSEESLANVPCLCRRPAAVSTLPPATTLQRLPSPYSPPGRPLRLPPLRRRSPCQSHTRTLPSNLVTAQRSFLRTRCRFCELLGRTWHPSWIMRTSSLRSASDSATALRPYRQPPTAPFLHKGLKKTQSLLLQLFRRRIFWQQSWLALRSRDFQRILDGIMAKRSKFPTLALNCGNSRVSDANAKVDVDKTFEIWSWQIVTECSVTPAATFSSFLQIARRITYLTGQFKQDYKGSWPCRHCALDCAFSFGFFLILFFYKQVLLWVVSSRGFYDNWDLGSQDILPSLMTFTIEA